MTATDWDAIRRNDLENTLRLAKQAEAQERSIAAFFGRKQQRAFIKRAEAALAAGDILKADAARI